MEIKIVVRRGEAGYFVTRVPALKGCWSQGNTRDEAVENAKEAAALWLEVEQEKRTRELPSASEIVAVQI